jgi:hypothetical protein
MLPKAIASGLKENADIDKSRTAARGFKTEVPPKGPTGNAKGVAMAADCHSLKARNFPELAGGFSAQ